MKQLGAIFWIGALFCFASLFISELKGSSENTGMIFVFALALIVYLPLILYNWLWGHQKGHRLHFIAIIFQAICQLFFGLGKSLVYLYAGLQLFGFLSLCLLRLKNIGQESWLILRMELNIIILRAQVQRFKARFL